MYSKLLHAAQYIIYLCFHTRFARVSRKQRGWERVRPSVIPPSSSSTLILFILLYPLLLHNITSWPCTLCSRHARLPEVFPPAELGLTRIEKRQGKAVGRSKCHKTHSHVPFTLDTLYLPTPYILYARTCRFPMQPRISFP